MLIPCARVDFNQLVLARGSVPFVLDFSNAGEMQFFEQPDGGLQQFRSIDRLDDAPRPESLGNLHEFPDMQAGRELRGPIEIAGEDQQVIVSTGDYLLYERASPGAGNYGIFGYEFAGRRRRDGFTPAHNFPV